MMPSQYTPAKTNCEGCHYLHQASLTKPCRECYLMATKDIAAPPKDKDCCEACFWVRNRWLCNDEKCRYFTHPDHKDKYIKAILEYSHEIEEKN